ncbi:MAG: response regulator [Candidatus Omnitrophota bacterium]|jgi:CheY-like chemotaxis protein|nr:MAG: response regulator [Candidatus Omnitrophota bacterium]
MPGKILIIDDDADFREAISMLLEAKGYSVSTSANGKDGLDKAKSIKPSLILLDVMMTTKTEGFDLAQQFKSSKDLNKIPVIIITGIKKDMNLPFSFEADNDWLPVKAVLEKPVKPDILLSEIEKYVKA